MPNATLINGDIVDSADPRWKAECLTRHKHVVTMRSLHLIDRRDYLRTVANLEGEEAERRLRAAFLRDWEERKGLAAGSAPTLMAGDTE